MTTHRCLLRPLALLVVTAACGDLSVAPPDQRADASRAEAASTETITVSAGAPAGWVLQGTGAAQAVLASSLERIGGRGVRLSVGTAHADGALVRTERFAGTPLSQLTALGFRTYVLQRGREGATPFLTLAIDLDGDGFIDDHLLFRPTPALGMWQTWDALSGEWWSNSDVGSPDARGMRTLAAYLAAAPTARLASALTVGAWEVGGTRGLVANVDGIVVGVGGRITRFVFGPAGERF